MRLIRLRPAPGPRALGRPRLRAFPEAPWHARPQRAGGLVELPGRDWPALARAAWPLLPRRPGRVLLDARLLRPAEAMALALELALAAPPGGPVELWHGEGAALRPLLAEALALRRGVALARDLAAAAGAAPRELARRLRGLQASGIAVQRLKRRALRAAGFGGLLAASGGAAPRLVVMRWAGRIAAPPLVFAGVGLLGRGPGDAAGAAACAGAMLALALRDSPAPAAAVLALCAPGEGLAGAPVTLLGGGTLPAAAAGFPAQLALAEAIAYADRAFRPAALVSLARLSGAATAALGGAAGEEPGLGAGGIGAALFGTDPPLEAALAAAGAATGEALWPLPMGAGAGQAARGPAGPGPGQPGRAAGFLAQALEGAGRPWAHLELALDSAAAPGHMGEAAAAGFGVRLLDRLARQRFEDPHRL